ncbi:MAG: alpha/beta hydrolase, partial [bacterium]|nr:alpha/beta hydrolase [bacterium]
MNRVIGILLVLGFFSGCVCGRRSIDHSVDTLSSKSAPDGWSEVVRYPALDRVFYHPNRRVYCTPDQDGLKYEKVRFPSADGTMLSGWFIPATTPALGTVIHFHGNAQNMTAHYNFVSWVPEGGFNLFVFDYRGYGSSAGRPTRKGVYQDSVAAIKYIKTRKDIDRDKIIVLGQSIGGTNALAAVGANRFDGIAGVVIDSAFSSYKDVSKDHVTAVLGPMAGSLIGNAFSPLCVVDKISPIPLIIIHGTADRIVPYYHGKALHAKAKAPKELWTLKNARHTAALGQYRQQMIPRLLKLFRV